MERVNHKHTDGDLATLLCALSFATGLGFGGYMEHGLGSASFGLLIADELLLTAEDREAIFYGALLKDAACTACSAGISADGFSGDGGKRKVPAKAERPIARSRSVGERQLRRKRRATRAGGDGDRH